MANIKKKFTVYGNCQASALAAQLLAYPNFRKNYEYVPLGPCFSISSDEINAWIGENQGTLDLVLAHHLKDGWRENNPAWDLTSVSHTLKKKGRMLRYSDIYYRGVNPFLVYPKTFERFKHCDYLDLVSLTLYALGFSDPSLCTEIYKNHSLLTVPEIDVIHSLAEFELAKREEGLEIRSSARLGGLCKHTPAFHTFNHASTMALDEIANIVFDIIGLGPDVPDSDITDTLYTVKFPLPGCLGDYYSNYSSMYDVDTSTVVTIEKLVGIELVEYFRMALEALSEKSIEQIRREIEIQRQDGISGLVITAIERQLSNILGISHASLSEIGRLSEQEITPDFVLTKANPQAVGFMTDLISVLRTTLLPKHNGEHFSVLDLGAKTATGSELLGYLGQSGSFSKLKFTVTCGDIDPTFVNYSAVANPHVEYLSADVFDLERQWDIVICSHVVEHIPNPLDFVAKLRGIARRYIILAFPYCEDPSKLIPGHINSLDHKFLSAINPSRYEIYDGLFWSQSLCCISVIELDENARTGVQE